MKKRWLYLAVVVALCFPMRSRADENGKVINIKSPLTLEQATQVTLEQNPELKAMAQDAAAAKTKDSKARYWDDPMIGVRFFQIPFEGGFDDSSDIDYIVRQKFPVGGKAKAAAQMAYHNYQHYLHTLNGRGRELLRDMKTAYTRLYATLKLVEIHRSTEASLRAIVQSAQFKLAAGKANAGDAMLGQSEIAKVLADRQMLLAERQELEARLKMLMAVPPEEKIELPANLSPPEWKVNPEKLQQAAEAKHPTLESDKHLIEEKEWGVQAAKKEYIPDINLQAEYVQRPTNSVDAFTGEVMINVPLLVRKKSLGVKEAEAQLASARFQRQATANEVRNRVQELYTRMSTQQRILQINRQTQVTQARQAYQAAAQAYGADQGNFSNVLAAANMLLSAQSDYWKTFADHAASVFALEEAVGLTREEWTQWEEKP
jgi:outer membrane protein TolC